jgi:transmembrane sensor
MPETLPRIDQEVVAGIRRGDEQSLERVFRDRYPGLVQEANAQLDTPVGVPRVVEGAFRRAWEERATFATPEALDGFLHTAVHEGATRERKRLATLHRLEAGAHVHVPAHAASTPTVDEAWSHFAATLHAPPPDPTAAAHARAASRHDTAHHVAEIGKRRVPVIAIAIGLVIAVLVGAPLLWATRRGPEAAATRALASSDVRVVNTLPGQQASVTLLDGSRAALGADSKLVIAPDFGSNVRAAKLEGTALFTVAPGNRHPFQVRAGNASVTATGTTFGVHAFPADSEVTVVAREGSVTVKATGGTRDVAAAKGLVVTKAGVIRDATQHDLDRALGWTEDRLVIVDRPLRDALREMARWYGYDIKVRDSTLLNRSVSVTARLQSPRDAIAALERSSKLKFDYEDEGRTMVLRDPAAKPAKTK